MTVAYLQNGSCIFSSVAGNISPESCKKVDNYNQIKSPDFRHQSDKAKCAHYERERRYRRIPVISPPGYKPTRL